MTDRPKAKPISAKTRNDTRKNGKRPKGDAPHTRGTRLSGVEKILLGGGDYISFPGVGWEPSTQWPMKAKKGS